MYCISCGAQVPENAAFCPACGAKVANLPPAETSKAPGKNLHPIICAFCGGNTLKKVRKGEYLCEHCGSRFFAGDQDGILSPEEVQAKLLAILAEADSFAEKKNYQEELRSLTRGLEVDPEDPTLLLRLGRSCQRNGLMLEAMDYYRRAEAVSPDDPIVYVNQGTLYLRQDLPKEAKPLFEKALAMIEADPMSATAMDTAVTYGNYAWCIGRLGDLQGAKRWLVLAKKKGYSKDSIKYVCRDLGIIML